MLANTQQGTIRAENRSRIAHPFSPILLSLLINPHVANNPRHVTVHPGPTNALILLTCPDMSTNSFAQAASTEPNCNRCASSWQEVGCHSSADQREAGESVNIGRATRVGGGDVAARSSARLRLAKDDATQTDFLDSV
jgi:hypothetical protein